MNKRYVIVTRGSIEGLEETVNALLKQGAVLHGSPILNSSTCAQAMMVPMAVEVPK